MAINIIVIPVKTGIQEKLKWIPASAGMTDFEMDLRVRESDKCVDWIPTSAGMTDKRTDSCLRRNDKIEQKS